MPANFPERMSVQDVADILEYIKASDPNYVAPVQPEPTEEDGATEEGGAVGDGEATDEAPSDASEATPESPDATQVVDPTPEGTPQP
jgi:hypothetical protein